ncbi:50S ribosomal protein L10 [Candidatus Woesearchaeota archaeon]|jgi:large subunit ribosomal protein L10|nr:50S ribosomal protein L10 [Candidatus Woesearchaeota archaeon]MBT5397095.1 50S ribosomal protein L10 [Candidatus Woesearchaeota archaeon]MBT6367359.1 50S ribosomal protein L10 [Candidatus Woesearchaeota archaeon]MBT7762495.1 50S ribosomal protein L10 [Candidatus Woesearchaeota archaeon]
MVSDTKKKLVQELVRAIKEYPIVAIVNFENLPAQQLQKMRAMLREKGVIISMARKRLITLALKESKNSDIEKLIEKIKGMPALLFSKDNPFSLYATLQRNKSEAPAKAGQTSPKEIVVKAGATNFAPGPIISELATVGIKTKVENGKLAIIDDTTVAKEGDVISQTLADMLKRLDIAPMEVGLDLVAVWENGLVFDAKQLHVDEKEFAQNIMDAARSAMNLAIEIAYPTRETMELLVQKAGRDARTISVESAFMTEDTKGDILARSEQQALSVKKDANL